MEEDKSIEDFRKNFLPNTVYIEFPEEISPIRKDIINAVLQGIWKNRNKTCFEFTLKEFQELTGIFISSSDQFEEVQSVLRKVHFVCNEDDGFSMSIFICRYSFEYNKKIEFEITDMARRYFEQLSHWS